MQNYLVFKLVVSEAGKETYSTVLSYEAVECLVSNFQDKEVNNDFFAIAAKHSASIVREYVADKNFLSADVVEILSKDNSIGVLRNLARSSAFKKNATQELLERFITLDHEVAQSIARDVESFEQADANKLATLLASHSDPSVVASLAENYSAPKKVLKTLLTHSDSSIVNRAKENLEN